MNNRILIAPALFLFTLSLTSCANREEKNDLGKTSEIISVQRAHELIQKNQDESGFVILDIRTPQEYRSGHIEDAVNINFHDRNFREKLDELDREKAYLIYCRTAGRTGITLPMMKDFCFQAVYKMTGGIEEWKREGLPLVDY